MSAPKRTYHVTLAGVDHLVKAPTGSQALAHVVRDTSTVCVPSQDKLIRLIQAGVKVEEAGAEAS